jgi:hypothetical protein
MKKLTKLEHMPFNAIPTWLLKRSESAIPRPTTEVNRRKGDTTYGNVNMR